MTYRFRLTFYKPLPSFFQFEVESVPINLSDGLIFSLTSRDQDKLSEATKFHIEGVGYESKDKAREAGEKVRLHLKVINGLLGLELHIPDDDTPGLTLADHVMQKLESEHGVSVVNSIHGLNIFPDGEQFVEYNMSGRGDVFPNDPNYIINALVSSWAIDFSAVSMDDATKDTLGILNLAEKEKSRRIKFLLAYAALEQMVEPGERSENEIALIGNFQQQIKDSELDEKQRDSLYGALANLRYRSLKNSLLQKLESLPLLIEISGVPILKLVNEVVEMRNKIAHRSNIGPEAVLSGLIDKLRLLVMHLIWNTHQLPDLRIDRPASEVAIRSMKMRVIK